MLGAVEIVVGGIRLAARHRVGHRSRIVESVDRPVCAILRSSIDRRARQRNQVRRLAAVQRKVHYLLRVDDLQDRGALRLHHGCVSLHLHLLRNDANLHRHIDLRVVANFQHDTCLHVTRKAFLLDLQCVRSNRQAGEEVSASQIGLRRTNGVGINVLDLNQGAGHGCSEWIFHYARDLRYGTLSEKTGQWQEGEDDNQQDVLECSGMLH